MKLEHGCSLRPTTVLLLVQYDFADCFGCFGLLADQALAGATFPHLYLLGTSKYRSDKSGKEFGRDMFICSTKLCLRAPAVQVHGINGIGWQQPRSLFAYQCFGCGSLGAWLGDILGYIGIIEENMEATTV